MCCAEEADRLAKEKQWVMKADGNYGFRRVVASPKPLDILESRPVEVCPRSPPLSLTFATMRSFFQVMCCITHGGVVWRLGGIVEPRVFPPQNGFIWDKAFCVCDKERKPTMSWTEKSSRCCSTTASLRFAAGVGASLCGWARTGGRERALSAWWTRMPPAPCLQRRSR